MNTQTDRHPDRQTAKQAGNHNIQTDKTRKTPWRKESPGEMDKQKRVTNMVFENLSRSAATLTSRVVAQS